MTGLTRLLTALRDHIRETGWEGDENSPTWQMIDHYFLRNIHLRGDRLLKLHLRRHDDATLTALITGGARPDNPSVNVIENYDLFRRLLREETPSPNVGPMQSSRPARTPSRGRRARQVRSRATRSCGHRNTSAVRSGDDGADTTAEAASKPRCTV